MSAGFVRRLRLTRVLETSLGFGVALIVAPAGFGKSAVIDDAFGDLAIRVDTSQGESIERLSRALIASAAPQHLRALDAVLMQPIGNGGRDDDDGVLATWTAKHLRSVSLPIVLDDFHRVGDGAGVARFFERVIEQTIPHVRWIIVSRETPQLPVGTWVAHGMAMPLATDDLAFSIRETTDLATALGVEISSADAAAICTEAEGWPLVIRFALATWERTRSSIPLRIRTRGVLHDFLEEQVWSTLAAPERDILVAAATLREIGPDVLARIGFPDARVAIERLNRALPFGGRNETMRFRVHDVVRDFVLERHPNSVLQAATVDAAIQVAEEAGQARRALELATEHRLPERLRELLAAHAWPLISAGERSAVGAAADALRLLRSGDAVQNAVRGLLNASLGNDTAAEANLSSAAEHDDVPADLRSAVCIRLAELHLRRGNTAAALRLSEPNVEIDGPARLDWLGLSAAALGYGGAAEKARERIIAAESLLPIVASAARAQHALRLGYALFYIGDIARAETFAHAAVELGVANGNPAVAARAFSILYSIATNVESDAAIALHYARQWAVHADEAGENSTRALGLVAVLAVAAEAGDDAEFESALVELRKLRAVTAPRHQVPLRYARAVYEAGRKNMRNAIVAVGTIDLTELSGSQRAFRDALLGMLHAANGEPAVAEPLLQNKMLALAGNTFESQEQSCFAMAYRSLGMWLLGRQAEAQRSLPTITAGELGERDKAVLAVIRSICATPNAAMTEQRLDELIAPLRAANIHGFARFFRAIVPAANAARLTRAELAILAEYRGGSSTAEIASRLKRSPKTLYNHIDSASKKLGVSGRAAVLAVVVDQGWID